MCIIMIINICLVHLEFYKTCEHCQKKSRFIILNTYKCNTPKFKTLKIEPVEILYRFNLFSSLHLNFFDHIFIYA
jgi:hypothetical protein